jgi:hypothetical protein
MSNEDPRGHIEDDLTVSMIVDAVANIDATEFERLSSGDDVSELSSNTEFESIEVVPEGILRSGPDGFEASATVYITLNYGGSRDPVSMPDSYPAVVHGTIATDGIEISQIDVDTGSFYE